MTDTGQIRPHPVCAYFRMPWCAWYESFVRGVVFIVRCAAAATGAYLAARWIGLPHSVWAAMSAIIVSQERFEDTRTSLATRVIGTLIGIGVAIAINAAAAPIGLSLAEQIAAGVAVCALVARSRPAVRVCMWTCPIVLLTAEPGGATTIAGLYRGSEVILGALIGAALHWLAEAIIKALVRRPAAEPNTRSGSL